MRDPREIELAQVRELLRECRRTRSAPLKLVQHRRLMDALDRTLAIYDEPSPSFLRLRNLVRQFFREAIEFKVGGHPWWVRDRERYDQLLNQMRRELRMED